jgi:hypothetical protein
VAEVVEVVVVALIVAVACISVEVVAAVGPSLEEDSPLEAPLIMGRAVDSDLFMSQETWLMAIVHRH